MRKEKKLTDFDWKNLIVWLIGFGIYRWLMTVDMPLGNTLPDMVIVIALFLIQEAILRKKV